MDAISADDWRRIEHVLDAALALPAGERATYVGNACAGDAALVAQVQSLIVLADSPSLLDSPASVYAAPMLEVAAPWAEPAQDQVGSGAVFGQYCVVRELGRGGMATVYLADRVDGQSQQRVALKLVAHDRKSHELHRRFLVERQILARLSHDNIARLLDGGVTDDGQPWFAMEYIDGTHITEHCDARRLTVNDRLRLFRSVCKAVHYAHVNLGGAPRPQAVQHPGHGRRGREVARLRNRQGLERGVADAAQAVSREHASDDARVRRAGAGVRRASDGRD